MVLTWHGREVSYVIHSLTYVNNRQVHEVQVRTRETKLDYRGCTIPCEIAVQCYMEEYKWIELFGQNNYGISNDAMVAAVSLHGWCTDGELPSYDITGKFPDVHIQRERKQSGTGSPSVDDEAASKINTALRRCTDAILGATENYNRISHRSNNFSPDVHAAAQQRQTPINNSDPSRAANRWNQRIAQTRGKWQERLGVQIGPDYGPGASVLISGDRITAQGGSVARQNTDQSGLEIDEEIKKILGDMKCAACENPLSHPHNMAPYLGNEEMKKYIKFCDETKQVPTLFCCSCFEIAEKYPRITDAYRTMIDVTRKLGDAMRGMDEKQQSIMDAEEELTEHSAELKKKEDELAVREKFIIELLKKAGLEK